MKKTINVFENDPFGEVSLVSHTTIDFSDEFDSDQMPILAARVSHANDKKTGMDKEADISLMRYLAKHKHHSVFEHQTATFKITCPLFVSKEWMRHRTQSYNEVSMRYSSDPVGKLFVPDCFRKQASRNKQSSAGFLDKETSDEAFEVLCNAYESSLAAYHKLIKLGVAREQARMVIPVGNYTEFYATANLRNWFHFWVLRHSEDAQYEIRVYADAISEILTELWPDSWGTLIKYYNK